MKKFLLTLGFMTTTLISTQTIAAAMGSNEIWDALSIEQRARFGKVRGVFDKHFKDTGEADTALAAAEEALKTRMNDLAAFGELAKNSADVKRVRETRKRFWHKLFRAPDGAELTEEMIAKAVATSTTLVSELIELREHLLIRMVALGEIDAVDDEVDHAKVAKDKITELQSTHAVAIRAVGKLPKESRTPEVWAAKRANKLRSALGIAENGGDLTEAQLSTDGLNATHVAKYRAAIAYRDAGYTQIAEAEDLKSQLQLADAVIKRKSTAHGKLTRNASKHSSRNSKK